MTCVWCDEEIGPDEVSVRFPHADGVARQYHRECFKRTIIGGANHLMRLCECYGGSEPPDAEGMTKREAAREAVAVWEHPLGDRGDVEWAEGLAVRNAAGTKEYSPFVCRVMNKTDPRVRECRNACGWVSPYGWVPEAGCPVHDGGTP